MACDICGDNTHELLQLQPCYQSREIKQVCRPCEKMITNKLWEIRSVTTNILCRWIKRFMFQRRKEKTGADIPEIFERGDKDDC